MLFEHVNPLGQNGDGVRRARAGERAGNKNGGISLYTKTSQILTELQIVHYYTQLVSLLVTVFRVVAKNFHLCEDFGLFLSQNVVYI